MAKILIVDDEASIVNPCVALLRRMGYDIYGAKNSKEAFALLEEHKPDILILDINLREEVDGFRLLKKGLELNSRAQSIILTGGDTTMKECPCNGVKALLKKPVDLDKLINTINEFIKNMDSENRA